MGLSEIEWTDYTFNPWIGCTKVSPGCTHCYAEAMQGRFGGNLWGEGDDITRKRTSPSYWAQPERWARKAAAEGTRARVFCGSLCDWAEQPQRADLRQELDILRDALFAMIWRTRYALDWLLLSKRPQNIPALLPWLNGSALDEEQSQPWPNVWIGVTMENQERADERKPLLQAIPAARRFISYEPALACVDWGDLSGIDWLIFGSESGTKARPADWEWARSARDQCDAFGVAYFLKQWVDVDAAHKPSIRGKGKVSLPILDGQQHAAFPASALPAPARG